MSAERVRMSDVADALWHRYRGDGEIAARTALLDMYLGLVHHTAREMMRRVPTEVELDDLVSAGTVGLVQALEAFDPERGLAFSTYAVPRVRGAILDELRRGDWMPRSLRTKSRALTKKRAELEQALGREPNAHELADALGVEMSEFHRWREDTDARVVLTLDHAPPTGDDEVHPLAEVIPDRTAVEIGEEIERGEEIQGMQQAFASLPTKDRLVLALYYYESLNLKQIGEVLHVTESRASQIRTRALKRLRDAVVASGDVEP